LIVRRLDMPKITADEFARVWSEQLKAASSRIVERAEKVTEAPGKKAAAAKDVWVAKMTDPGTADRWARRVASVSLEEWKAAMRELVPSRLPTGVEKATPKMVEFGSKLLPYQDANIGKVHSIKKITKEDARRRMNMWFDIMSAFKYK
jgi:hypothetical protein